MGYSQIFHCPHLGRSKNTVTPWSTQRKEREGGHKTGGMKKKKAIKPKKFRR